MESGNVTDDQEQLLNEVSALVDRIEASTAQPHHLTTNSNVCKTVSNYELGQTAPEMSLIDAFDSPTSFEGRGKKNYFAFLLVR